MTSRISLTSNTKIYLLLNLIFGLIIISVFIYSAAIDPDTGKYPVPSFSKALTGENTISTGLSRSFSELMRLNFKAAADYNPYGFRIWLFLVVQLMLRLAISGIIICKKQINIKPVVIADSFQAIFLFIIAFMPFLSHFFKAVIF